MNFYVNSIRFQTFKAAKEHTCAACMGTVMKGEEYAKLSWYAGGRTKEGQEYPDSQTLHVDCAGRIFLMPPLVRQQKSKDKRNRLWRGPALNRLVENVGVHVTEDGIEIT